jgi:hypothetical protein
MTAGREELTREVASVHREDGLLDDRDFFKHTVVSPMFGVQMTALLHAGSNNTIPQIS